MISQTMALAWVDLYQLHLEVPDTRCPVNPVRLHSSSLFYPPYNASANDVIELFVHAVTGV